MKAKRVRVSKEDPLDENIQDALLMLYEASIGLAPFCLFMPQRLPEDLHLPPLAGMALGLDLTKATPEVQRLALDLAKALNYPEEFLAPIRKLLGMEAKKQEDFTFLSEV